MEDLFCTSTKFGDMSQGMRVEWRLGDFELTDD